jgi:hypothetical protein
MLVEAVLSIKRTKYEYNNMSSYSEEKEIPRFFLSPSFLPIGIAKPV